MPCILIPTFDCLFVCFIIGFVEMMYSQKEMLAGQKTSNTNRKIEFEIPISFT